jgi:hypothetical protein
MGFFDRFRKEKPVAVADLAGFEALIHQSMEELRLKTAGHDGVWHIGEAAWNIDQDAGTLTFTPNNGMWVTCSMQIIGTRSSSANSWLWAWGNSSIPKKLQRHAMKVREHGEQTRNLWLTTPMMVCPSDKAWGMTAIACKLNDAQGAYRGVDGDTEIFMTFDAVKLTNGDRTQDSLD